MQKHTVHRTFKQKVAYHLWTLTGFVAFFGGCWAILFWANGGFADSQDWRYDLQYWWEYEAEAPAWVAALLTGVLVAIGTVGAVVMAWVYFVGLRAVNSMAFGFRLSRALIFGAVVASVYIAFAAVLGYKELPAYMQSEPVVPIGGWLVAGFIALHLAVPPPLRHMLSGWRLRFNRTIGVFGGIVLYGWILGWMLYGLDTIQIRRQPEAEQTALLWYWATGAMAMLLFAVPARLTYWGETLREHTKFVDWFRAGRGGSARWAGPSTLKRHRVNLEKLKRGLQKRGGEGIGMRSIYLGRSLFDDGFHRQHVAINDDAHMLTIGMTGSGKSLISIWPNLAMRKGSATIVIDPDGEHARMSLGRRNQLDERVRGITKAKYHYKNGQALVLDPYGRAGMYESARYNPLAEIDIESDAAVALLSAITDGIVVDEGERNRHWVEGTKTILQGVLAHVLSTYPKEMHTLPTVFNLLMGKSGENEVPDLDGLDDFMIKMGLNNAAGGVCHQAADLLSAAGDEALGNFKAGIHRSIKFIGDPVMRRQLAGSDIEFAAMGLSGGPLTLFIIMPTGQMSEKGRWFRMITEVSMTHFEQRLEKPKEPVLYILDEFPQYGKDMKAVKRGIVTLRKQGVKLWPFVQSYGQLAEMFGPDGAAEFESSATVQLFGVNDTRTSQWASRKLGNHAVIDRQSGEQRKHWWSWRRIVNRRHVPLIEAEELEQMLQKNSPRQVVFPNSGRPMRLERLAFKRVKLEGRRFAGLGLRRYFDEKLNASAHVHRK